MELFYKKNGRYKSAAFYIAVALSAAVVVYLSLTHLSVFFAAVDLFTSVCAPLVYGFIFAYLFNPLMKLYERRLFGLKRLSVKHKKLADKLRRPLSLLLTVISVILFLTLFFMIVLPQIAASYNELESQIGHYISAAQSYADAFVRKFPLFNGRYENLGDFIDVNELTTDIKEIISNSYDLLERVVNYLFEYGGRIVIEMKNIVMGFIIAVYFLFSKERLCAGVKKFFNAVLPDRTYLNVISLTRYTDRTFGGFIIAKIIDSVIIGLLTFIVLTVFRMPFPPLISVIIGVTNVIPFFGPFIGAIPSAFIVFIASPGKTIWFLIIVLVIQQLDGNIIGPKIIGDSTGMSSLAVLISLTVASGFFGLPGMVFGVPAGAVICALMRQFTEYRLKKKGAPIDTEYYINTPVLPERGDLPILTADDIAEMKGDSVEVTLEITEKSENK